MISLIIIADKEPESNPYDITTFQAVLESAALTIEATNEKLVRISRRLKLSVKRTIAIATAQYQQHCLLDPGALAESKTTG